MQLVMTLTDGRRVEHVRVTAAGGTRWGDVVTSLPPRWARPPGAYSVDSDGGSARVLDEHDVVGEPPLLHGVTVAVAGPCADGTPDVDEPRPTPRDAPTTHSPAELLVVEGPDCGHILALPAGRDVSIGRDPSCTLTIVDAALSRHHCSVRATRAGVVVSDHHSTNGVVLEGTTVQEEACWVPGQRLAIGRSVLELVVPAPVPLPAVPDGEGHLVVSPTRVVSVSPHPVHVQSPTPPEPPTPPPTPVVAWVLPLVVSVVLAAVLRMPLLLAFGLMAPAMVLGGHVAERHRARRAHRAARARHRCGLAAAREAVDRAVGQELAVRRAADPDLARWAAAVRHGPSAPLWSASPRDGVVPVRLGRGEVQTTVELDGRSQVGVDGPVVLEWTGTLGVVGPRACVDGLARGVLCQLLLAHDPSRLRLVSRPPTKGWDWLAWAPHLEQRRQPTTLVLEDRRHLTRDSGTARPVPSADGVRLALRLADSTDDLGDVDHLVQLHDEHRALVQAPGGQWSTVTPDLLARTPATRMVRGLAPWRTTTQAARDPDLPCHVDLTEVTPHPLDAAAVLRRWEVEPRSTRCVLGVGADGPVSVDLVADGPHALVAGTTGAGKSELLRTLVAGLALANRPDELVMVLVDYKGGAAFADCADLPHCVGLVTDLDPHLADRALASLGAELTRRERVLSRSGARDLDDHRSRRGVGGHTSGDHLPRLLIVIDEFRALAEELPTFVDGLVRLAALGRSLGVHLVLATQRPGGIVSADVRANVNLRVALRLRDASDSLDVLDTVDAAGLPEGVPGRALVRTGAEAPRMLQVARPVVTPVPPPRDGDRHHRASVAMSPDLWEAPVDVGAPAAPARSALPEIAQATRAAAEALDVVVPASPWLAPLPTVLPVDDLAYHGPPDRPEDPFHVPWGMLDLPRQQRRATAHWHPVRDGSLGFVGAPRSGATTVVRTLLTGVLERNDPGRVHLYLLDGGVGLGPWGSAAHTGALVTPDEPARAERVLARLVQTVEERRRHLAAAALTSFAEQQRSSDPWPLLLWVVDGWGRWAETLGQHSGGAGLEAAHRLLAEGPTVGVVGLLTGGRSLLTGRTAGMLATTWSLRLGDPADLLLAGLDRRQVPTTMPPGRVVRTSDGVVGQVALVGEQPDGAGQLAAVATRQAALTSRDATVPVRRRPWRVVELPARCSLPASPPGHLGIVVGVGGDEATPVALDLAPATPGASALVLGAPGSGRSTALRTLATALQTAGHRVVTVTPGCDAPSLGAELAAEPAPCVLVDDADLLADTAVERELLAWWGSGSGPGCLVAAADVDRAGAAYRGLVPLTGRSRCGIVLRPRRPGDGAPLGATVPVGGAAVPGRGVLVVRGTCTPLQVAQVTDALP